MNLADAIAEMRWEPDEYNGGYKLDIGAQALLTLYVTPDPLSYSVHWGHGGHEIGLCESAEEGKRKALAIAANIVDGCAQMIAAMRARADVPQAEGGDHGA